MLSIYLNGNHSHVNNYAIIDHLLNLLDTTPLDKNFENFGNFVYQTGHKNHKNSQECVCFFGSFRYFSYPFRICTDEPEIIKKLTHAIRSNQQKSGYLNQESGYLSQESVS